MMILCFMLTKVLIRISELPFKGPINFPLNFELFEEVFIFDFLDDWTTCAEKLVYQKNRLFKAKAFSLDF